MKKVFLIAILALGVVGRAQAAGTDSPFNFMLVNGLTYGGDTLINMPSNYGPHDTFKAGGLVQISVGGEYRLTDTITLQNTVGLRINEARGIANGSARFTNVPVDMLGLYSITPNIRVGGGLELVGRPELKGSGAASGLSQNYDSTSGVIVKSEYLFTPNMGLELRFVSEKFKPSNGGANVDGSHVGLMFNYYF